MKKFLIASIIGVAASVSSLYGQGYIIMQNYALVGGTPVYSAISYGPDSGHTVGSFVGSQWKVELLYQLGANPFQVAAGSLTSIFPGAADGGSPTTDGAGTFIGPSVTIPGYSSGSCNFMVRAFNGAAYASSALVGTSPVFTISGLQTDPLQAAGDIMNLSGTTIQGIQPFSVSIVPEPSTFALAGLGSAALLIFRRRK